VSQEFTITYITDVARPERQTIQLEFSVSRGVSIIAVRYENGATEQHDVGTMFGQTSLLAHQPSDVEIRAISNMLLLRLPTSAFNNAVMQYPSMLAHLSELTGSTLAKVGM